MTNYTRGRQFEYRTKKKLEAEGWVVFRSAGSHSPADLIALRTGEVMLVQCKGYEGKVAHVEREKLLLLANELGVRAVLAQKQGRKLVMEELTGEKI